MGRQAQGLVNQFGLHRARRGDDVAPARAGVLEDRALAVQQRVADRRGREPPLLLQLHPVGQVLYVTLIRPGFPGLLRQG